MQRGSEPISPVESQLSYWVSYVGNRIVHQVRRRTLEFGVTAAESVLMRKLREHEGGAMPSLLALQLGLSRGHISRLAIRLETKGLIDRDKSPSDRRALILTLTGVGRALIPYLAAAADRLNARNFAVADDASLKTIEALMKWIVRRNRFRFASVERCRLVREQPG